MARRLSLGRIVSVLIFVFVTSYLPGQVFYDSDRVFYSETDALIIPSIHFGYGLKQYDFMDKNTGLAVDRSEIRPEIYLGCQLLSNGFMIGVHYGFLQNTIMLGGGWNFPIHLGNKNKK